jgi:selenide,water dikinase
MQTDHKPFVKDLVLLGGGHAHVSVLKKFAMQPQPGVRLTLITRDIHTPYSGMLPGYIAGFYDYDDCHIDLGPLARFAGARLVHAEADSLDIDNRLVLLPDRPAIHYDLLSINTGSRPGMAGIEGAAEHVLAVKPIDRFLEKWQVLIERVLSSQGDLHIVVVGGGAGGVELALSTQYRLQQELGKYGGDPRRITYTLVSASDHIMFMHNVGVRQRFERILKERKINALCGHEVVRVGAQQVVLDNGDDVTADAVLWATSASSQPWIQASGVDVDEQGFIRVNDFLQSTSHPQIFAAGDIASLPQSRAKSGVFAVRQGPVLAHNLKQMLTGNNLKKYRAQKNFLGLISTGNRYAVASRGGWSYESAWLWRVKDWIDRRFMQQFNQLPDMQEDQPDPQNGLLDNDPMRCGGCGAKVGSSVLSRVMQRLPEEHRDDVLIGRDAADDCAMLSVPASKVMVQSVDYFRAFIDDAYTFGAIAANHALGDLFAMGAEPQSALAIATVPYAHERIVEDSLYDLLAGALSVLQPAGAVLAGGHSSEGAELAFGLTVNGVVDPDKALRKSGLQPGDALILTKSIGTGTLFAADMRARAKGRWIEAALQSMQHSSQQAVEVLRRNGVTACTDITGFGLVGHLHEMTLASRVCAELLIDQVPVLSGAVETARIGILSSLQPQNQMLQQELNMAAGQERHAVFPLLFDPQTAGGLLAAIPMDRAQQCVKELKEVGYTSSAIIGHVTSSSESGGPITIK